MIRSFSTKVLAAVAGASMLAMTLAEPASAFTLASPNLGHSFAADGQLDTVYWRHWGHPGWGWHRGWGWHGGWGWRRPGWGWGPRRHCWMSPWGWRCRWW